MPSTIPLQSGGAAAFVFLFAILLLIVGIAMIFWVYQDAQTNSTHPAFLWALVVFFAPFLGIVLYFLVGRDRY